MKKTIRKKITKDTRKFVCLLLSNMKFIDRVKFVMTGNYLKALQNSIKNVGELE